MRNHKRNEVIMAGTGGKGVLLAGQLLGWAGIKAYQYVSWTPTYFATMRAGSCECTVILSDSEIASPILTKSDVVVVFEPSQLADFQGRVKLSGLLIAESAGLPSLKIDDVRILSVPAVEVALGLGDARSSNIVLLGAYIGATDVVTSDGIEAELHKQFGSNSAGLSLNIEALHRGMAIGADRIKNG